MRLVCACALGAVPVIGCGGDTGVAGAGGIGGNGGTAGALECTSDATCDDGNECTEDTCTVEGRCDSAAVADGSACGVGSCVVGACEEVESVFPCTEQGIRDAVAAGGGPNGFACDGPQTITTELEISIDNDVILDGLGRLTVDGAGTHRPFSVDNGITAELRRFTVIRGLASEGNGGGILNSGTLGTLTVTDCTVADSRATIRGGGIANFGTMKLIESSVSGNTSESDGGGGVLNTATLMMTNSSVSGNTAAAGNDGGGMMNTGTLTMTGSTVSGNEATRDAGGIANFNVLMISNSTVSGNTAARDGGGIWNNSVMTMQSCTLSKNTASAGGGIGNGGVAMMSASLVDGDCSGVPITSAGHNIESPGDSCGFGEPSDDLKLELLADNGGPTLTHALGAGSVAIDVIPEAECVDAEGAPMTIDQRGEPRPETGGADCDVGAFEVQP